MAWLINGKEIADKLLADLKNEINQSSVQPGLGVILVGDDKASHLYVNLKAKAAELVGIKFEKYLLPEDTPEVEVINIINKLNSRPDIHGILVQLPLPEKFNEAKIISAINPNKDADGFHPTNIADFLTDQSPIVPGLANGIIKLIKSTEIDLTDKKVCLVANSKEFSLPIKHLLEKEGLKVEINLQQKPININEADIIIVAVGQPNFIKSQDIKEGAIIIDVGTNKIDNKLVGDVEADSLVNRLVYLTPVPGGVGPMTVAMLLWNVWELYKLNKSS